MVVAISSSSVVVIRYVLPVLRMTSCFSVHSGPYSSVTDVALIHLFTVKSDRIQFPIIKWHNFDYFEITHKLN